MADLHLHCSGDEYSFRELPAIAQVIDQMQEVYSQAQTKFYLKDSLD